MNRKEEEEGGGGKEEEEKKKDYSHGHEIGWLGTIRVIHDFGHNFMLSDAAAVNVPLQASSHTSS